MCLLMDLSASNVPAVYATLYEGDEFPREAACMLASMDHSEEDVEYPLSWVPTLEAVLEMFGGDTSTIPQDFDCNEVTFRGKVYVFLWEREPALAGDLHEVFLACKGPATDTEAAPPQG